MASTMFGASSAVPLASTTLPGPLSAAVNSGECFFVFPGKRLGWKKDLGRYFTLLGALYAGSLCDSALLNLPPTQKTPQMKRQSSVANLVSVIAFWNSQLPTRACALMTANPGASVTFVDT
ncbi:hypothetical protein GE09DRAFT_1210839 [Coniochaeta sp. 2T2.1]|nr:hypothetical protein GE09DRAFT_1210839 [Coniochaeta sp. 2T2.1]